MTVQLEVIKFRDLIPIQSIPRFVPELGAPAIELIGDDFSSVDKVLINDIPSPEFIVISKHKLFAELPDGAQSNISNIQVISSRFTRTNSASMLSFEIGDKTRTVEGVQKLLQLFTKWILQTPGSDIFNPDRGGGLQELAGQALTTRNMDSIIATVSRAVENTSSQIRSAQIKFPQLPLSERLLAASVIDLDVFEKQMEARLRVSLQSMAGPAAVAEIGL